MTILYALAACVAAAIICILGDALAHHHNHPTGE